MSDLEVMYKRLLRVLPEPAALKLVVAEAAVQARAGKLEMDSKGFLLSLDRIRWAI